MQEPIFKQKKHINKIFTNKNKFFNKHEISILK